MDAQNATTSVNLKFSSQVQHSPNTIVTGSATNKPPTEDSQMAASNSEIDVLAEEDITSKDVQNATILVTSKFFSQAQHSTNTLVTGSATNKPLIEESQMVASNSEIDVLAEEDSTSKDAQNATTSDNPKFSSQA